MSEVSSRRRRLGIAAITTTALALPLTASITYAQAEAPLPPAAPVAPLAPAAPLPPQAPEAPEAPTIEHIDPDDHMVIHIEEDDGDGERRVIRRRIRHGEDFDEAEFEAMMERIEADMEGREEEIRIIVERAMEHAEHAMEMGEHARELAARAPQVEMSCDGVDESGVMERDLGDGRRAIVICQRMIHDSAIEGMRAAMHEMRNNRELSSEARDEALREMERAIRELERERRSIHRIEAKLERRNLAPNARSSAVAMRWSGRMTMPVAPAAPAVPAVFQISDPAPVSAPQSQRDTDCEERATRA